MNLLSLSKKFTILLLVCSLYLCPLVQAQAIDTAFFQCRYKLSYINDSLSLRKQTDEMRLLIGEQYTLFSSYINYTADSLTKANPAEYEPQMNEVDGRMRISAAKTRLKKSDNIETYIIQRHSGDVHCLGMVTPRYYEYMEERSLPAWEMDSDTEEILGYICQKAQARYGGRDWTVWFTSDIPIGEGPWLLRGLPGLILKAHDAEQQYVFECISLGQLHSAQTIETDILKQYRSTTKEDYWKGRAKVFEDPLSALSGSVDLSSVDMSRVPARNRQPKQYNPIER